MLEDITFRAYLTLSEMRRCAMNWNKVWETVCGRKWFRFI
jgi:hypothetical protein